MQYISALHPNFQTEKIINFLAGLTEDNLRDMGRIIFDGHDHHNSMGNMGDVRGEILIEIDTAIAYLRDLGRHNAAGRFIPAYESGDLSSILSSGFNRNYQIENMEIMAPFREAYNESMSLYEKQIWELYSFLLEKGFTDDNLRWVKNLLPLGHQTKMLVSAPVKQLVYLLALRLGPGGDFGYRKVASMMLELISEDPVLAGMLSDYEFRNVDPNNIQQGLLRS
jgi:hypothetical protein